MSSPLMMSTTDVVHAYLEKAHNIPFVRCTVHEMSWSERSCVDLLHPLGTCVIIVVVKSWCDDPDMICQITNYLCCMGYCSYFVTEGECETEHACAEKLKKLRFVKKIFTPHEQVIMRALMEDRLVPSCYAIHHYMVDGKHVCRVTCRDDNNMEYLYAELCWVTEKRCVGKYENGEKFSFVADPELYKENKVPAGMREKIQMQREEVSMRSGTPHPGSRSKSMSPPPQSPTRSSMSLSPAMNSMSSGSLMSSGSALPTVSQIPNTFSSSDAMYLQSPTRSSMSSASSTSGSAPGMSNSMPSSMPGMSGSGSRMTQSFVPKNPSMSASPLPTVSRIPNFVSVDQIDDELMSQSPMTSRSPQMNQSSSFPTVSQIPQMNRSPMLSQSLSQSPQMSQSPGFSSLTPPLSFSRTGSMSKSPVMSNSSNSDSMMSGSMGGSTNMTDSMVSSTPVPPGTAAVRYSTSPVMYNGTPYPFTTSIFSKDSPITPSSPVRRNLYEKEPNMIFDEEEEDIAGEEAERYRSMPYSKSYDSV